jgi:hypothetical protein
LVDFRKQQEYLQVDDGAFTNGLMDRALKLEKKRFLSRNRYINLTLVFIVFVFALVTAQLGWILFGQEPDGIPIFRSATLDSPYFNAFESPTADQLEVQISSLNKDLEKLSSMTTDLKSRQVAADRLEERISKITKDLQILSDLAANVASNQRAALATVSTVVPATQNLVSITTEQTTIAQETPVNGTKLATVAVSLNPKLDTASPTSKRETSRTVPKERQDGVVGKQRAASVPQNRPWTINLISSPDKTYAVSFSDKAQSRGISTELQEASVKGTPYWRVQITGFSTQDEAITAADTVKDKLGLTDIWIMKR